MLFERHKGYCQDIMSGIISHNRPWPSITKEDHRCMAAHEDIQGGHYLGQHVAQSNAE